MTTPTARFVLATLTALAVLASSRSTPAQTIDPLRCEARRLRCESELYQCAARCERRGARDLAAPAGARPAMADHACEERCADRYAETLLRIETAPPCAPGGTPDAAVCEARLLRTGAAGLVCQARCGRERARPGFDAAACLARCATRCTAQTDETLAQAICGQGRVGAGEICR